MKRQNEKASAAIIPATTAASARARTSSRRFHRSPNWALVDTAPAASYERTGTAETATAAKAATETAAALHNASEFRQQKPTNKNKATPESKS